MPAWRWSLAFSTKMRKAVGKSSNAGSTVGSRCSRAPYAAHTLVFIPVRTHVVAEMPWTFRVLATRQNCGTAYRTVEVDASNPTKLNPINPLTTPTAIPTAKYAWWVVVASLLRDSTPQISSGGIVAPIELTARNTSPTRKA
jgi:hypothetical protein